MTIAHADEISLVRHDTVLTVTPSVTQHAPCRVALAGPVLFSANSPSKTVSRFKVDQDGNFALKGVAGLPSAATNGLAIVDADSWR